MISIADLETLVVLVW